ncbi:M50 family metallopeptidase [Pseudothermotoga thermarum]|uniref:Peptidase M50 n=1 Tax=Pseudothermotoga thermarum DSM 5069 TaxID=688269 RepID=F7YYW5_9THEM|nr:site-2 protease family protein [Pseudothermotoga thermarum]AEH51159.1 peptidase M50 [Pseudothermotoga thermarum DSM 5069]
MSVVYFLLILMAVITVHELGHFVFARMFGVDVLEFAIGFGPKIYEKKGKRTNFRINVFPIGGYVRLAGEDVSENYTEGVVPITSKPAWQRLLIFASGPIFSILAGYFLFILIVASWGIPVVGIAQVEADSPAQMAGLQPNDLIIKVNGSRVYDSYTVTQIVRRGKPVKLTILREGKYLTVEVQPVLFEENHFLTLTGVMGTPGTTIEKISGRDLEPQFINSLVNQFVSIEFSEGKLFGTLRAYQYMPSRYAIGFYFSGASNVFRKDFPPFQKEDVLLAINGFEIKNNVDLARAYQLLIVGQDGYYLEANGRKVVFDSYGFPPEVEVEVLRKGKVEKILISSNLLRTIFEQPGAFQPSISNMKLKNPLETIIVAVDRCNKVVLMMYRTLFGGRLRETGGFVGPIGLVSVVSEAAKVGLEQVLTLVAFITMSLGIFNLLPLPALDGGRIAFSLFEMITRKKIDPKIEAIIHTIGFVLLMMFMIFVTFSDVGRLLER